MHNGKLAFNLTSTTVVALDVASVWLGLCCTVQQYADFDQRHGPFNYGQLRMVGEALLETIPPAQELSGLPAQMLSDALIEILQRGEPAAVFKQKVHRGGVSSVDWRDKAGSAVTVVYGHKQQIFFTILHSLPQLQEVQRRFFPDEPGRVAAFQSTAKLPASSDELAFEVVGDAAIQCIQGCWKLGYVT